LTDTDKQNSMYYVGKYTQTKYNSQKQIAAKQNYPGSVASYDDISHVSKSPAENNFAPSSL